jgi:hypothetical protein
MMPTGWTWTSARPSSARFTGRRMESKFDKTLTYRGSGSDLATDIKAMLSADELARLLANLNPASPNKGEGGTLPERKKLGRDLQHTAQYAINVWRNAGSMGFSVCIDLLEEAIAFTSVVGTPDQSLTPQDVDSLPPIGRPQTVCRKCGRPTEPGSGFHQCHYCKRLWPYMDPPTPTADTAEKG